VFIWGGGYLINFRTDDCSGSKIGECEYRELVE